VFYGSSRLGGDDAFVDVCDVGVKSTKAVAEAEVEVHEM
jgi:hypothetical protein